MTDPGGDLTDDEVWGPGWNRTGGPDPDSPENGAPGLFDEPPPVEQAAAPASPRPAPLLYYNPDAGELLASLDDARTWALIGHGDTGTVATVLDSPPGGLEWSLCGIAILGLRPGPS